MSSRIVPMIVILIVCIHYAIEKKQKKGNYKTYCFTIWFVDMIFSVCGVLLSFSLFHYEPVSIINRDYAVVLLGLGAVALSLIAFLPGGIWTRIVKRTKKDELIEAQYRINESFCVIRNCLYFGFVVFLCKNEMIHAGYSIIAFAILVPISIRQTLYWLINMVSEADEKENTLILQHNRKLHYRHKNIRI